MGLTHSEFYRSLPPAIAHHTFSVEDNHVRIDYGDRVVTLELGSQQVRSIASLRLPYVEVRFTFDGFSATQQREFMARFERYFRRGGG